MAEKYGARPSDLLSSPLGAFAIDCEVFGVATKWENDVHEAIDSCDNARTKGLQGKLMLEKLKRDAEAELKYEERHGE